MHTGMATVHRITQQQENVSGARGQPNVDPWAQILASDSKWFRNWLHFSENILKITGSN
jgi:hypothetical protein